MTDTGRQALVALVAEWRKAADGFGRYPQGRTAFDRCASDLEIALTATESSSAPVAGVDMAALVALWRRSAVEATDIEVDGRRVFNLCALELEAALDTLTRAQAEQQGEIARLERVGSNMHAVVTTILERASQITGVKHDGPSDVSDTLTALMQMADAGKAEVSRLTAALQQAEQERDEARAGWNTANDRAMLAEAPERDR